MIQLTQEFVVPTGLLFLAFAAQAAGAAGAAMPPYLDTHLTAEQRAADLVGRMTLAEKSSEMQNNSAAVPRLNVPAYQWWSEALHGVINEGVTEYPEPIGLAATDPVPRHRATHRIAELTPTSNAAAASWQDAPASTARTTRSRKSCE